MEHREEILRILAFSLQAPMRALFEKRNDVEEIRLRAGQPLAVTVAGQNRFVCDDGGLCDKEHAHRVTMEELRDTVNLVSSYSRYAFEDKIRQGFLTIQGGHRVGLAGRTILEQNVSGSTVKTIAPITFLNIRVARQVVGCAEGVLPLLRREERGTHPPQIYDTLLVSPPGGGKTTLLRDLIRLLSRQGVTVGVVDERSELGACYQGIPQNDLGPCTDVLDGCPKAEGLMMLVRSMSPQVVAVDEVGREADHGALEYAMHCGCRILATVHGSTWEEMRQRPLLGRWLEEKRFGRYVFLEKENGKPDHRYQYRVCDATGKTMAVACCDHERS